MPQVCSVNMKDFDLVCIFHKICNHLHVHFRSDCLFSSPEHNMLKGSFKGGDVSVVCRPSCFVNNFFKHLLLPNRWANLDQTWQECSLEGPLQKLLTEFDSIKNSGCHSNEIEFFKQFLKNLLLRNH